MQIYSSSNSIPIFSSFSLPSAVNAAAALMLHGCYHHRPHLFSLLRHYHYHHHHHQTLDSLLHQCSSPHQSKQIHALLLLSSPPQSSFLFARLIALYSRFDLLPHAQSTFDSTSPSSRTSLLWNSILRANLSHSRPMHVVSLYLDMNSHPDAFTFPLVIRACAQIADPELCSTVHTHAAVMGFDARLHVGNELVAMYAELGRMDVARKVFDRMPVRSVVSWNLMVNGFSKNFDWEGTVGVFRRMEEVGPLPNFVTWTGLMSAHARCRKHLRVVELFGEMRGKAVGGTGEGMAVALSACPYLEGGESLKTGKKIHSYVVRAGFEEYPFVRNSLVCMYGKLGCRDEAEIIFWNTKERSLVSWNAWISSYAASGLCNEACNVFSQLERSKEFKPDVVSWSAVIKGFSLSGMAESSLDMFRRMQSAKVVPNPITIASVLSSCTELSALCSGKEVHGHAIKALMDQNVLVRNGLINMYTKSGSLKTGIQVFDRMKNKDLISWNTMITGFGMNGFCNEALATFNGMVKSGINPDGVTFISLLSGCSHGGKVAEGRQLFHRMLPEFKLMPTMEHYSCMVDLLGRAGLLVEAKDLITEMPFEPNACVVGALLNACRIHGNTEVAEDCVERVSEIVEGEVTGNFMMLSNIYSACGDWGESARVRVMMMRKRGLKKQAGQSWIEVAKKVYKFSAGGSLPVGAEEVYEVIVDLSRQMEVENCGSEGMEGEWGSREFV